MRGMAHDATERRQALKREKEARMEAEAANRVKDEFLSTLSHELRTPLTAIMGWSDLLLHDEVEPEKRRQAIETIFRNANSQCQLINDLLEVSRIITGKLRLEFVACELAFGDRSSGGKYSSNCRSKRRSLASVARTERWTSVWRSRATAADRLEPVVERREVYAQGRVWSRSRCNASILTSR